MTPLLIRAGMQAGSRHTNHFLSLNITCTWAQVCKHTCTCVRTCTHT